MRPDGYYWVRYLDWVKADGEWGRQSSVEWEVAKWVHGEWYRCGDEMPHVDSDIAEVGERVEHK